MPIMPMHHAHSTMPAARSTILRCSPGCWLALAAALSLLSGCSTGASSTKPREFRPRTYAVVDVDTGKTVVKREAAAQPIQQTAAASTSAGGLAGACVPYALPSFVTIDRSTDYALVHDADHAVLIIAAGGSQPGVPIADTAAVTTNMNALWWIVEVPNDLHTGKAITIGNRYRAWLLERAPGQPTHGSPAHGGVTVHTLNDETLTIDLDLAAPIGKPTAGYASAPAVRTSDRVTLAYRMPQTQATPTIDSTTGAAQPTEPVRLPIWTALWPDEWKPAGWKYESPSQPRP